jgi:hypothetical protein
VPKIKSYKKHLKGNKSSFVYFSFSEKEDADSFFEVWKKKWQKEMDPRHKGNYKILTVSETNVMGGRDLYLFRRKLIRGCTRISPIKKRWYNGSKNEAGSIYLNKVPKNMNVWPFKNTLGGFPVHRLKGRYGKGIGRHIVRGDRKVIVPCEYLGVEEGMGRKLLRYLILKSKRKRTQFNIFSCNFINFFFKVKKERYSFSKIHTKC